MKFLIVVRTKILKQPKKIIYPNNKTFSHVNLFSITQEQKPHRPKCTIFVVLDMMALISLFTGIGLTVVPSSLWPPGKNTTARTA